MAGPVATVGASILTGAATTSGVGSVRPRPTVRRIDSMNVMAVFYASIVQEPLRDRRNSWIRHGFRFGDH